jgi:hypothetical protein
MDAQNWSVWRDYERGVVVVQQEGREPIPFKPDDARSKVDEIEELMEQRGLDMTEETEAFHEKIREFANELE